MADIVDVRDSAAPADDFLSDLNAAPSDEYGSPDVAPADDEYGAPSEPFTEADVVTGYEAPVFNDYSAASAGDEYGSPGDIFTGVESVADYENVPVYNPIDTNSVETNTEVFEYEYEEEPLTSYISVNSLLEEEQSYGSPGENTLQNVPVEEAEYVSDVSDDDSGDDYDSYDDYEEELPSYIIPAADAYQASPSISVEYASPRDQQGLVIDLTENYDDDDDDDYETAVYGQRLTGISSSHSSHNILSSLRHHRLLRSRL